METNSGGNITDASNVPEIQLEETNKPYIIVMTTIGIVLLVFMIVTSLAMRRTKSTPETARFLSSGLMAFDISGIISFTLRRFIAHRDWNSFVQVLGVNSIFLAYLTIGIMSLERYIVFSSPHFYLRRMTPDVVKRTVWTVWIISILIAFFIRYGLCFAVYQNATMDDVIGRCLPFPFAFFGFFMVLNCLISSACFIKIFLIERRGNEIRKPNGQIATFRTLMRYKTTGLVLLYIVSVFVTTLLYSIIMPFYKSSIYAPRIALDLVNLATCIIDPLLYVLWFRECRYEVMRMFECVSPRLADNLEKMRMRIFNIVVIDSKMARNTVQPLSEIDSSSHRQYI